MSDAPRPARRVPRWAIALGVIGLLGLVLAQAWHTIPPGFVGIEVNRATQTVSTRTIQPGWTLINPFVSTLHTYPATIQTLVMLRSDDQGLVRDDDAIKIQSREGQELWVDLVVQYRLDPQAAAQVYTDWGGQSLAVIETDIVRQHARAALTILAGQYGWEEITGSRRGELRQTVTSQITTDLARWHLIVEDVTLREIHLPEHLQTALTKKITAQQAAIQQQYQLDQARITAEQVKVEAEGQAQAQQAIAAGDAEVIRLTAEAQAAANHLLAQTLTANLVQYLALERWDGTLSQQVGPRIVLRVRMADLGLTSATPVPNP